MTKPKNENLPVKQVTERELSHATEADALLKRPEALRTDCLSRSCFKQSKSK